MPPLIAEALGTFWIVLIVGGLAAEGLVAPGLAMGAAAGIAYLAGALTLGQVTTGHFHPALTLGLRGAKGFGGSLTFTLLAQITGAVLALLLVDAPPPLPEDVRPGSAMLLLVPLIGMLVIVHVVGMRMRAEAVAYANAVALTAAVALAPGGHAGVSAAHATAAWLTGDGAPIALWRILLATLAAVVLAQYLWSHLLPSLKQPVASDLDDEDEDWEDDTDDPADEDDIRAGGAKGTTARASKKAARSGVGPQGSPAAWAPSDRDASPASVQALIEAGWTPPGGQTPKGRVRKNTPLRKPTR